MDPRAGLFSLAVPRRPAQSLLACSDVQGGAGHPADPAERYALDAETGAFRGAVTFHRPITVGAKCWIGAGAIIVGGVTIGDGTTIGAGSVVTRDIPAGVVAAGNPCRIIRAIAR